MDPRSLANLEIENTDTYVVRLVDGNFLVGKILLSPAPIAVVVEGRFFVASIPQALVPNPGRFAINLDQVSALWIVPQHFTEATLKEYIDNQVSSR